MNSHSQTDRTCDSVRFLDYRYPYLFLFPIHVDNLTVGAMDGGFAAGFGGGR